MKNKILMLISIILSLLLITGCNNNNTTNQNEKNKKGIDIRINTIGLGQVAYSKEEETLQFDEEYPVDSLYISANKNEKYIIGAKANEGWKFIKWTKDGKDYSKKETIKVTALKETELIAVFEIETN